MTNREAFDKVKTHLLTQKAKSHMVSDIHKCLYRGPDGKKCAIGAIIPDDEYNPGFEGKSTSAIMFQVPSLAGLNPYLLRHLQYVHDELEVYEWENYLNDIEREYFGEHEILANQDTTTNTVTPQ